MGASLRHDISKFNSRFVPGASGYYHHGGSLPLPLPARHERGEGWGEGHVPSNRIIGIPSPLPSPHSCVVGRGNRPAAWWWFELPSTEIGRASCRERVEVSVGG